MKTTEEILKELGKFMFDNGITIIKSENDENKIVVSIYRKHGLSDEYEFLEEVDDSKISQSAYTKLS
jgi:hypothetical protein